MPSPHAITSAGRARARAGAAALAIAIGAFAPAATAGDRADRAPSAGAADAAAEATRPPTAAPAVVILVRHAEKAEEPHADPPLTAAGRDRARALAAALADAGVTTIVTSDRLRTRATAAPLAESLGVKPILVGLGDGDLARHVAAVVAEVRRHPGEVVLVVGHSDTVPSIIAALGGPRLPDIPHGEFANMFTLVPAVDGQRLVRGRYGAPDGAAARPR